MKDYDNTEEITYIMYFDANNLYGSAMTDIYFLTEIILTLVQLEKIVLKDIF